MTSRDHFRKLPPEKRLGDAPIDPLMYEVMMTAAGILDQLFNGDARGDARGVGFVLLTFPYGSTDGRCNYMSNGANREDIVTLMKEMTARFQGQPEVKGKA